MRPLAQSAQTSTPLHRTFAATALVGALGAIGGGVVISDGYGIQGIIVAACGVLLISALVGIYAEDVIEREQRGEIARVYAHALTGTRDRRMEQRAAQPTRAEILALSLARFIDGLRLTLFGHNSLVRWGADMRLQLATRQRETQTLAAGLTEDAHAIADAARGSRRAETAYNTFLEGVRAHAEGAAVATGTLMDHAQGLTEAVRAVTAETEKATAIASRLAETAFATQRGVAAIGDSTGAMLAAADQIHHLLHRAEIVGLNAGLEAARAGEAGRGFAVVAQDVKQLAEAGGKALENMLVTVRDLREQTALIVKRIEDMSDIIQAQHEFGHALSHASMVQADAVGQVLHHLGAAQGQVRDLNREVHDISLPEARIGMSVAAQEAVERLPGYAEAMAQILRGLPDFNAGVKKKEKT